MADGQGANANKIQRSDNIVPGATLATIGLTVPGVLVASFFTGNTVEPGLDDAGIVLLSVTLVVSMISASLGRTNILQGAVPMIIFVSYIILIFDYKRK